jgi:hypothetical protein
MLPRNFTDFREVVLIIFSLDIFIRIVRESSHSSLTMMASLLKTKFPWVLCTIFSFIYFYLFSQVSTANPQPPFEETGLIGGFCVWGEPAPELNTGCKNNINSHMYAWYEDAVFTMIVVGAYYYGGMKETVTYVALGGIVFFHGLLHFYLSTQLNCLTNIKDEKVVELGWTLYLIFAFFLSLVIFGIGFFDPYGWKLVLLASSAVTAVTYHLASGGGPGSTDWLLSTLFATSHPIASVTGCFTTSPLFTNLQGWIFLVATLDGIVELMFCESFLKQYGGHIFYDLFLHTAVIVSLPVFHKQPTKQKMN